MSEATNRSEGMVLARDAAKYCQGIFDTVRRISADGLGVTRQGYSAMESEVIDYLKTLGEELALEIYTDHAGNVWMTFPGKDRELPSFVSGSHADSVPQGGNYDGLAGIVAALSVAWWMRKTGYQPQRDYVVLIMRCEESSFFGKAYIGSLALTGQLKPKDIMLKHRSLNMTLGECISACGFDPSAMTSGQAVVDLKKIAAFVELHIEQGPVLDSDSDCRVGVITGIRGNLRHKKVRCLGQTAHSGAVDKADRHDALMATVDLIHRMDKYWDQWLEQGHDLVFTVGVIKTNDTAAISVIPGEVTFTVDMRSLSMETIEAFQKLLIEEARKIENERGVHFQFDALLTTKSAQLDQSLGHRLMVAAKNAGVQARVMPSGAGHDSAVLANQGVSAAMIFVANQKGSHNPYEAMKLADFMQGVTVLWQTVKEYDD